MKTPKLSLYAVPSRFPNCPAYFSQPDVTQRPSREQILQSKEEEHVAKAMEKRLKEFEDQKSRGYCSTLSKLYEKLNVNSPWQQMKQPNEIKLCYVQNLSDSGSQITAAMRINEDMMLDVYVKLTELGSLQLPAHIDKVSQIYEICDVVYFLRSFNAANTKAPTSFDLTLQLVNHFVDQSEARSQKVYPCFRFYY